MLFNCVLVNLAFEERPCQTYAGSHHFVTALTPWLQLWCLLGCLDLCKTLRYRVIPASAVVVLPFPAGPAVLGVRGHRGSLGQSCPVLHGVDRLARVLSGPGTLKVCLTAPPERVG